LGHAILLLGLHDGVPTATDRKHETENTPLDVITNYRSFKSMQQASRPFEKFR
jgi:hypothetical protein